jgi:heptosyltransferase-2
VPKGASVRLPDPILVVQTAFLGDVVLTLPVVQTLRELRPGIGVDMLVTPRAAAAIAGHPDIREVILYDKRGADSGAGGFFRILREVRRRGYACALIPHRSVRSALLARMAGIPVRAGFDTSAGRFLFTVKIPYRREAHEIERNLTLLGAIGVGAPPVRPARLYPSAADSGAVDAFLGPAGTGSGMPMIVIAPGTLWNTKRWPAERYSELARALLEQGYRVVLVGGPDDAPLCGTIGAGLEGRGMLNACGRFTVLGSAELMRRAAVVVCNDSAPLHLAGGVGTPVLAIFGATVPSFGFGPIGPGDGIVETSGLPCRPCSIHGGDRCPIGTFECMTSITAPMVLGKVISMVRRRG